MIDATHDPKLQSWVESANQPGCDFPIQNLPWGSFNPWAEASHWGGHRRSILDASDWLPGETLNDFCALPRSQRSELRRRGVPALQAGLQEGS